MPLTATNHQPKQRRVLVVVSNPLGGIRSYLLYNGSHLSESGYVFTFLAPEGEALDAFKSDVASWPGVECIGVRVRKRKVSLWPSIRRAIRSRRFSLVHSQGLRAGMETAFVNLGLGVPHVITLHDVIVPQNDVPGRLKWVKKRITGWFTSRADVIVAVSHDCGQNHLEHFPEWKRGRCRVEMILNGVDVERLTGVAEAVETNGLRNEFGFPGDVTVLGFFGRFMPQKGFLILLDALRELARRGYADGVRLVATKDPHGYGREYMRKVERDDLLSRIVRFVDTVPDIATLLPQIDLLVMPSLWEAYGLLAAEAMILGILVVGSDAIGLREVLRGTPSLAPPAGDAKALASAIEEALGSRRRERAEEFTPLARIRFDNAGSAEKLRQVYEAIAR